MIKVKDQLEGTSM